MPAAPRLMPLMIALTIGLAGCVAPSVDDISEPAAVTTPVDPYLDLSALMADIPCLVAVGEDTSENLLEAGFLANDGSLHGEIDMRDGRIVSARYQLGGFEIIDATDPLNLVLLGAYEREGTAYDVKWMPNSTDTALVGYGSGIAMVDVTDPAAPTLVTEFSLRDTGLDGHTHMIDTHRIGDTDWVFIAPNSNLGVYILQVEGEGANRTMTYIGNAAHPVLGGGPLGPHDMTVLDDAKLEKPILYVANGFEGWLAFDVSDPTAPTVLGGMVNADPGQGYMHKIQAEWIGGKRLVAIISEVGVNMLKVYDATEFMAPILIGEWVSDATRPTLPQHNLQIVNDLLFVSHYGQGMYAFNLSNVEVLPVAGTLDLTPIAHYSVGGSTGSPDAVAFTNVWDTVLQDGVVFVNDINAGIRTLGFGCIPVGDESWSSQG